MRLLCATPQAPGCGQQLRRPHIISSSVTAARHARPAAPVRASSPIEPAEPDPGLPVQQQPIFQALSAFISGGNLGGGAPKPTAGGPGAASALKATSTSAAGASTAPPPTPPASSSKPSPPHPLLGTRLLNLAPGTTPSVLAAALGATATDSPALASTTDAAAGDAGSSSSMVHLAEVQGLLAGLRGSLQSIQASRANYVRLLAERDTMLMELQVQLQDKEQRLQALQRDLEAAQAVALQAELDAEAAAALAAAAADQVQAQAQQISEATAAAKAAREAALAAVAQQQQLIEQQQQAAAALAAAQQQRPPTPRPQAPARELVILYKTRWDRVNAHFSADGKPWTTNPGVPLEATKDQRVKVLRLPDCGKVEVVFNNGRGEWDSPPGNYRINSPGTYRIEHGNVRPA